MSWQEHVLERWKHSKKSLVLGAFPPFCTTAFLIEILGSEPRPTSSTQVPRRSQTFDSLNTQLSSHRLKKSASYMAST